jgi:hypothetical protein
LNRLSYLFYQSFLLLVGASFKQFDGANWHG